MKEITTVCMARQDSKEDEFTKLVDEGGRIVPDATIKAEGMVAQLVQDLLHLKGRQHILNEDTCLHCPCRNSRLIYKEKASGTILTGST